MGVTQNSFIPRAWEVSDLKVKGAYTWYITITYTFRYAILSRYGLIHVCSNITDDKIIGWDSA